MPNQILHTQAATVKNRIPDIQAGYTVRVHEKVKEGEKERVQIFEGLVIAVHKGHVATDRSFTVRRVVSGIGVEKVFPMLAPTLEKVEVKKIAKVRRAKLYFLRGRTGKAARLSERFTNADEFSVAVPEEMKKEEVVAEAAPEAPVETTEAKSE